MKYIELQAAEFKSHFEQNSNAILIDVREEYEHEDQNIGGENVPMGDVLSKINQLENFSNIYFYCKSGKRSKAIAYNLSKHLETCNIYSCAGGIQAYNEL
ncbi:MAG: rhodanese-like domain-containing protein [Flavobacteriales bacterium]|nr:rhodanese-like domain-containing protein [Flavobacteriales bacterium]